MYPSLVFWSFENLGSVLIKKNAYRYRNSRYKDNTVFIMEIPMSGKTVSILRQGPEFHTFATSTCIVNVIIRWHKLLPPTVLHLGSCEGYDIDSDALIDRIAYTCVPRPKTHNVPGAWERNQYFKRFVRLIDNVPSILLIYRALSVYCTFKVES